MVHTQGSPIQSGTLLSPGSQHCSKQRNVEEVTGPSSVSNGMSQSTILLLRKWYGNGLLTFYIFPCKCHTLAVYLLPAHSLSTLQWELVPAVSLEDEQEKKSRDLI